MGINSQDNYLEIIFPHLCNDIRSLNIMQNHEKLLNFSKFSL